MNTGSSQSGSGVAAHSEEGEGSAGGMSSPSLSAKGQQALRRLMASPVPPPSMPDRGVRVTLMRRVVPPAEGASSVQAAGGDPALWEHCKGMSLRWSVKVNKKAAAAAAAATTAGQSVMTDDAASATGSASSAGSADGSGLPRGLRIGGSDGPDAPRDWSWGPIIRIQGLGHALLARHATAVKSARDAATSEKHRLVTY